MAPVTVRRFYDACAPFYDDDYESIGRGEDVAFYVERARRAGGPVLEMGCGSGRVLVPTARAGVEVAGVDASPRMLARLAERLAAEPAETARRVRLVEGDLTSLDLAAADLGEARFALVTAPFRVIQHLVSRREQRAWLAAVARHLAPGGELVFDVFQPQFDLVADGPAGAVDVERVDAAGRRVRRVAWVSHHPELQTFDLRLEWLVDAAGDRGRVTRRADTTLRWFTRAELENLLELAGFEVLEVWGGFDGRPHGPGAEEIVVRAALAAPAGAATAAAAARGA